MTSPTVAALTLGCKVNQAETAEILQSLSGFARVPFNMDADLVLINTCAVTLEAEKQSRQMVRRALRRGIPVIVTGCAANLDPEAFQSLGARAMPQGDIPAYVREQFPLDGKGAESGRTRAFLKVTEGCTNFCTYCIVPLARGPERDVPLAHLIERVRFFQNAGVQEVVLTGTRLATYGQGHLEQLVARLLQEAPDIPRWRLSSMEPLDVSPETVKIFADPRICPNLHLPLQSGSDAILTRMNRRYLLADYARVVESLRAVRPDLALTTDLIVGFPGETEEDFEASLMAIQRFGYAGVHAFPYSPRPKTPSATWAKIPDAEVAARMDRMLAAAHAARQSWLDQWVGKEVDVLTERVRHPELRTGLTPHALRVEYRDPAACQGERVRVRIVETQGEGGAGVRI